VYEINTGTHVQRIEQIQILKYIWKAIHQHTGVNVVSTDSHVWKDYMVILIPQLRSANSPKI
jgi:hypothetical protein